MEESSLHTFEGWLYHNRIALHNDVIAQQNDLRKGKILKLVPRKKKKSLQNETSWNSFCKLICEYSNVF